MSLLEWVRIAAGLTALLCAAYLLRDPRKALAGLREFLLAPSSAVNPALLRIGLFGGLTWVGAQSQAVWWAGQAPALRGLPPGWAAFENVVPIEPGLVGHAQQLLFVTAAAATLGLWTRVTAPLAALSAVYVLGIPNFFGRVHHYDHGLVLCCLVLAAAPCGDALSFDRLWKRSGGEPPPAPSPTYTLPVRLCWLLLGTIYLFPGLFKLWESGDLWVTGQKLRFELLSKWGMQNARVDPPMRIDQYPWLLSALGAGTVLFEIGFIFALFKRSTRIVAALSAVAFHVGVRAFLGIRFYPFVPLILLADLPPSAAERAAPLSPRQLSPWPAALVGGVLLAAQCFVGLAQIDTWPVALHPKFSQRGSVNDVAHNVEISLRRMGGKTVDLGLRLERFHARSSFVRSFLAFDRGRDRDDDTRRTSGRELLAVLRDNGIEVGTGDAVVFYKTQWNVFPIGEREGFKKKFIRRYRVSDDDQLIASSSESSTSDADTDRGPAH